MILKPRYKSLELELLKYLYKRMNLSEKDHLNYLNLNKGFIGEQHFDEWLHHLPDNWLILNDLLFEFSHSHFQIDSMVITNSTIYIFEVKNYDGDYYMEDDRWFSSSGSEIKNPILQLKRTETLLRKLLQDLQLNMPIKAHVIFINPEFHLYHAPRNQPIIYPTQIQRFFNRMMTTAASNTSSRHTQLAKKLISLHIEESPYTRIPEYTFEQLKKGVICARCGGFIGDFHKKLVICKCSYKENASTAVLRSIKEYTTLFPNNKINTNAIYEWCKIMPKRTISRILSQNFNIIGHGQSSYYI
ncbi:NERD domain-containing protein [Bacillus sp. Gen3]|nr:NERD domain-containing protein [Bacillus sp. Gen3]